MNLKHLDRGLRELERAGIRYNVIVERDRIKIKFNDKCIRVSKTPSDVNVERQIQRDIRRNLVSKI